MPNNLIDEKDLPEGWEDQIVDRPAISLTGAPQPNPDLSGANKYASGAIPPILGLQPDLVRTQIAGRGPVYRLFPTPSSGLAQSNAATSGNVFVNQTVLDNELAARRAGTQADNAQAGVLALQATSFLGAYNAGFSYSQGASVDSGGAIFISLVNLNVGNDPATSPTKWAPTGNSSTFVGIWNTITQYEVGNQVIDTGSGGYYICLVANINFEPDASPAKWQLITAGNLNSYEGNYSGSQAYTVGELVSFQGALWVSTTGGTGNTPSLTSSFWSLLGSNSLFTGPWSSSTAYQQNMFVSQNGNVYQALTANTNVDPATHPATWQLSGPATLDNLVDGSAFQKVLSSMVNLVPDSDLTAPTIYWPGIGGTIQYEAAYPAAPFCPAFFFGPGTGSPTSFRFQYSKEIAVIPGATYTLSGFIDANSVTSGTPTWNIFDPTITTNYAAVGQTAGHAGRVSTTFTVPGGVTRVVCLLDTSNCTLASGQFIFWFQPQLVAGSNAGAYISSSQDYLSGTVLINFANTDHTNKNLNSIPDGTTVFGSTTGNLSYRPTTNPLSSTDSGGGFAAVAIAAFNIQFSSKGLVSYSSGSITGLLNNTNYFIFTSDPTISGGAVSYSASTSKTSSLAGSGNIFVGSIVTASAGGPPTIGANDGGNGNQGGGTLVVLSTAQSPAGTGGYGNLTPSGANTTISNVGAATEQWLSFIPQNQAGPSAVSISVTSSVTISGAGSGNAIIKVSTDGGSTFPTTIYNVSTTRALTTDVFNFTLPLNVTQVVLQAQNSHTGGSGSSAHFLSGIQVVVQL